MQAKNGSAPDRPAQTAGAAGGNPGYLDSIVVRTELFTMASRLKEKRVPRSQFRGPSERLRGSELGTGNPELLRSLHLDCRSLLLELGLDGVGLILRDAALHCLRRAVHEVLRLLEAEAGQLAHDLDDLNLLGAGLLEDDVELRLLFDGCGSTTTTTT